MIEYQCTRSGIRSLLTRSINNSPSNLVVDEATGTLIFRSTKQLTVVHDTPPSATPVVVPPPIVTVPASPGAGGGRADPNASNQGGRQQGSTSSASELRALQGQFTTAQVQLQALKLALLTELPAKLKEAKAKLDAMTPGSQEAAAQSKAIEVINDQIATKLPKQIENQNKVIADLQSKAAKLGGTLQ